MTQGEVCVLSSGHSPHAARLVQEAQTLNQAGYSVFLIGPGIIECSDSPYNGFISICADKKRSSRVGRLIRLFCSARRREAGVYHAHELDSLFVALVVGRLNRTPVVFDCHEYHAEAITESRFKNRHLRQLVFVFIANMEAWMVRKCCAVISVNDDLASKFAALGCHSITLPNYPSLSIVQTNPIPEGMRRRLAGHRVLVYAGKLSETRGISLAVRIVAKLTATYPSLRLLLVGRAATASYRNRLQDLIKELGVEENVLRIGQVKQNEVFGYLSCSDIGLFLLCPVSERYNHGEPIKMFEYAAAGLAVVISDLPAKRKLVNRMKNGLLVDVSDEEVVVSAILHLLSNPEERLRMGECGSRSFGEEYNWEAIEDRLISLYERARGQDD